MTTKIKTALLAAFFIFGLLTGLQAQDKYNFGVVSYAIGFKKIRVSANEEYEIKVTDSKDPYDLNPVFKVLNEMQEKGWEIYQSSTWGNEGVVYFLRKKKN